MEMKEIRPGKGSSQMQTEGVYYFIVRWFGHNKMVESDWMKRLDI